MKGSNFIRVVMEKADGDKNIVFDEVIEIN